MTNSMVYKALFFIKYTPTFRFQHSPTLLLGSDNNEKQISIFTFIKFEFLQLEVKHRIQMVDV